MTQMEILYEDDSVIVIRKPAGLAAQSADISRKDCVSLLKEHIKSNDRNLKGEPYIGIIHRLDQPVEGILVFAKNESGAALLSEQVRTDIMNKHYTAIVDGIVDDKERVTLVNDIYKDSKGSKAVIVPKGSNPPKGVKVKRAELDYTVIRTDKDNNVSRLSIDLKTGRFHQIRAQMSEMGHPILGDFKYGSSRSCPDDFLTGEYVKGAIALKADRLTFIHPISKEKMSFS